MAKVAIIGAGSIIFCKTILNDQIGRASCRETV